MLVKTYILVNDDKVERALNGTPKGDGSAIGGIGQGAYQEAGIWKRSGGELSEAEVTKLEADLIAEYDKLGGLIKRGSDKVKTGSFYDFKGREARPKPQVVFYYRINGRYVEVPDGAELPGEVKAAKILDESETKDAVDEEVDEKPKRGKKSK